MSEKKSDGHGNLTYYIIGAIIAAIATGYFAPEIAVKFDVGGEVFLSLLMMMVVPLVVMSVMSGILGLGDVRKLGKPGAYAIGYYMCTTVLAVLVGLIVVNIIKPGVNKDLEGLQVKIKEVEKGSAKYDELKVEIDKKKKEIQEKINKAAAKDEKARKALEERKRLQGDGLKKLEGELKFAQILYDRAESDLKENSDSEILKQDFQIASYNLQEAKDAIVREKEFLGVNKEPTIWDIIQNMLKMLVTDNLFKAASNMNLLPLIVFSIIFAAMLTTMGDKVFAINRMIGQGNEALMSFVMLLMNIAPIGIFCLVAGKFGHANLEGKLGEMIGQQGYYILTILLGLGFHAFITLFAIYWFFTKKNPFTFFKNMSQAILTAFSTASSSATLPVTMECAVDKAGISKKSTKFVLPLGATINMDGTALYEAAAAIFIAQIYVAFDPTIDITLKGQMIIALTATLAAIGAAGIPEAGLVTMMIVLTAAKLPVEAIGLILMVDWLLDRFRTAVNCFGDSVGAAIVDGVMKDADSDEPEEGGSDDELVPEASGS